jgi:hypothetical protein
MARVIERPATATFDFRVSISTFRVSSSEFREAVLLFRAGEPRAASGGGGDGRWLEIQAC